MSFNTKRCLICKPHNDTLYFHMDVDTGDMWLYCNKCARGYSLYSYCHEAGISLKDFLKNDFDFQESRPNEVNAIEFPTWFITLSDPRAKKAVEYIKSRGLKIEGDMYYDTAQDGIVFPLYHGSTFVGGQVRFINTKLTKDGDDWKITTMPGTRLGLLFYGYSYNPFVTNVKGIIVCEGAFNALSINQALNEVYGGIANNPWKAIALSGCGVSKQHLEVLKEFKDAGLKVVSAFDADEAGVAGFEKMIKNNVLTHYAFSDEDNVDWNDKIKQIGHKEFAQYFLKRIKKV